MSAALILENDKLYILYSTIHFIYSYNTYTLYTIQHGQITKLKFGSNCESKKNGLAHLAVNLSTMSFLVKFESVKAR